MRLDEFASAEEQIALWKLISDSVWQSLSAQQRQEAEQKQAQKLRKPKAPAARKKPASIPSVPLPVAPVQQTQPAKSAAMSQKATQQSKLSATQSQRKPNPPAAYVQQPQQIATAKSDAKTALSGQKTLDMRGNVVQQK